MVEKGKRLFHEGRPQSQTADIYIGSVLLAAAFGNGIALFITFGCSHKARNVELINISPSCFKLSPSVRHFATGLAD